MIALTGKTLAQTLQGAGLSLTVVSGNALAVSPAERLTDELRSLIRANKSALIEFVQASSQAANDPAPVPILNPDLSCWPGGPAWNTAEIERFTARLLRFAGKGLQMSLAEQFANKLVLRDREWDDRRACLECFHCSGSGPWRCGNWRAAGALEPTLPRTLVDVLQRCEGFEPWA